MKKTNKKGFTIVELVIVIAVIAILAAVLIPTFTSVVEKANVSAAEQNARNAMTNDLAIADGSYDNMTKYVNTDSKQVYITGTYTVATDGVNPATSDIYSLGSDNKTFTKITISGTIPAAGTTVYTITAYSGKYDSSTKKYTYISGDYTCVYDTEEGSWNIE